MAEILLNGFSILTKAKRGFKQSTTQPQNKTANSRQKDQTLLSWETLSKLDYYHIVLCEYKN